VRTVKSVRGRVKASLSWYFYDYLYEPLLIVWKNKKARIGFIILVLYALMAILGPKFRPLNLVGNPLDAWKPPSLEHPLGCDYLGRDILSMLVNGAPLVLSVAFLRGLFVVLIGLAIGVIAGYVGGKLDSFLSFITDIVLNIPSLPLYIVLATYFKVTDPITMALVLSVTGWAGLARSVRSQVLSLKTAPFVEAAKVLGFPTRYIVFREITPNIMSYITINYIWSTADAVYAMVGLFFLGVIPFSTVNWGVMLFMAYRFTGAIYSMGTVHFMVAPIVAIVGLQLGLILFSYAMDEIFNPRIRTEYFRALR